MSTFELSSLVPESELDAVPQSELVVDDAEVVLDDMLACPNLLRDVSVLETGGDEGNDSLLAIGWGSTLWDGSAKGEG
jgi:hypothetical protein